MESISADISTAIKSTERDIDLTNCDREPIHTPNLIQPHGVLLAVSDDYQILQVSINTASMLGVEPNALLNQPLDKLLGKEQTKAIQKCWTANSDNVSPILIEILKEGKTLFFHGIVHRQGKIIIIELELCQDRVKRDFFDFYSLVKSPVDRLNKTATLEQLCEAIATEIKQITQFNRVMVYRFNSDGAGTVIAEAADQGLETYLGLNYPATDIPRQAKHLFTLKQLRLIPDVAYEPVGITPELNPLTGELLDMSLTVLRSVSPFHVEYLNNMGVGATLVISLVKDKQLWGLISCHNNTPKTLPYEVRTVCEFI
ncbi:MAG: GAF domain-containing protein, partial [Cyanobacteria bacterium J06600_6]